MKWFLIQQAIGEPEIVVREDDENLSLGYSLIAALARSGGSGLREVEPGVYWGSTRDAEERES